MKRPDRPRSASMVSPNVGIRVPRNLASNHVPASRRLISASVKSSSIHRRAAGAPSAVVLNRSGNTSSTSVVRSSELSCRHDDLAVFRQLQIELDERRALVGRQPEGGHGVFRRVGRRAAVGDEPALPGCRWILHAAVAATDRGEAADGQYANDESERHVHGLILAEDGGTLNRDSPRGQSRFVPVLTAATLLPDTWSARTGAPPVRGKGAVSHPTGFDRIIRTFFRPDVSGRQASTEGRSREHPRQSQERSAKRWLKALRAGRSRRRVSASQRAYPRRRPQPSLRDVQHALAREHGHESWIALRATLAARPRRRRHARR